MKAVIKIFLTTSIVIGIYSCNSFDDTNAKEVLTSYLEYGFSKSYEKRYELISIDSKGICSQGEYLKYYEKPDTAEIFRKEILKLGELESDANYPSYKRFRTTVQSISSKNDTTLDLHYWTLKNEDGHWRLVWNQTLTQQAAQKFNDADYEGCITLQEKAIQLNPYDGGSYSQLGWCFQRDKSVEFDERKDQMLKNFKYAISLEPDLPGHYNSIGSYYGFIEIPDLQIENLKKAIDLCLNEFQKRTYYANLSGTYLVQKKFTKATEAIIKSIEIDSTFTFNYLTYAAILSQQKDYIGSRAQFERALKLPAMEAALQSTLYSKYAYVCWQLDDNEIALKYVLLGLEITPNDKFLQGMYKYIKEALEPNS